MRVLIACEYSGRVRDAFARAGHFACSCDFEKSESKPILDSHHYQGDVRDLIEKPWDLIIAHPPCTFLTGAAEWAYGPGPYHQKVKPGTLVGEQRKKARLEAVEFVQFLLSQKHIKRKCLENPVGILPRHIGPASQIIQPHMFGDDASKATCLWLENLPPLQATSQIDGRIVEHPKGSGKMVKRWANQTDSGQNKLSPSADRWKERSRTYQGIANAMASQWGILELPG